MSQMIDVIIHADGRIEPLAPVTGHGTRRARLIILDPAPPVAPQSAQDDDALDALLIAAGLQDGAGDLPDDLVPLSEAELDAFWARLPIGTPLSQIVIEDREETF